MYPPPPSPKPYVVGVLDLLGYKGYLFGDPDKPRDRRLMELYETMFLWLHAADHGRSFVGLTLTKDKKIEEVNEAIDFMIASDTLMFWASVDKADFLIAALARTFIRVLGWGAPLRGAIALGDCIFDLGRSILIGYPIVEAVEMERRQDWLGVAVSTHAAEVLRGVEGIVPYDVPVRDQCSTPPLRYALAWHWAEETPGAADIYLNRLSAVVLPEYRAKYDNAAHFIRSTRRE